MTKLSRSKIIVARLTEGATREEIVAAVKTVYPDAADQRIRNQIAPTVAALRKRGYELVKDGNTLKIVKTTATETTTETPAETETKQEDTNTEETE